MSGKIISILVANGRAVITYDTGEVLDFELGRASIEAAIVELNDGSIQLRAHIPLVSKDIPKSGRFH